MGVVYIVRLRIVFSKAALQKRGSIEPMEPPLDPPLALDVAKVNATVDLRFFGIVGPSGNYIGDRNPF